MYAHFKSRRWLLAALLSVSVTACMVASGTTDNGSGSSASSDAVSGDRAVAQIGEIVGDGPFVQFIVKYRDDSPPFKNQDEVQARADASGTTSGLSGTDGTPLKLSWQRRLGVGADVIRAERPLDRDEARRLMQSFAADSQVEYIEIDGIATHQQRSGIQIPSV